LGVREDLYFNMSGAFKEAFDKHCAISKGCLCLAHCALEGTFKIGLFAYNTHTAATTSHGSFDND
jgi:hypothetical protein